MDAQIQQLLSALGTMYSNADNNSKQHANRYLEQFRLSNESWAICHSILADTSSSFDLQTKLFAAHTLRTKISYHLSQVPLATLDEVKNSLIQFIMLYTKQKVKVVRTQLIIALVSLALQHLQWEMPVQEVIAVFETESSNDSSMTNTYLSSLLEFLKILPEECSDVNKTPLTDSEFTARVGVLIVKNRASVMSLLEQLSTTNDSQIGAAVLDCLNSWIAEIPITKILSTAPLYQLIFRNLSQEQNFDISIEVLISIVKETKDLENLELISSLYEELITLKPLLFNNFENHEIVNGLTRLFVEIGECWNASIVKNPEYFKDCIEILLKCCEYREDLDVIKYTFKFWFMSKQLLTCNGYEEQRAQFVPAYHRLLQIIVSQLKYPIPDHQISSELSTKDLFDGDLEIAEKFAEFRYEMGDVLKDCCVIIGANEALDVPFTIIKTIANNGSSNINWQDIEAPLFSMRSMAKEVDYKSDNQILDQTFQLLFSLIESQSPLLSFNKVVYAIILVFGRYTPYTYYHDSLLMPQFQFILSHFTQISSKNSISQSEEDILAAASNSLMYFCRDCGVLLTGGLDDFFSLLDSIKNNNIVQSASKFEIADGISNVIKSLQTEQQIYDTAKQFVKPILLELAAANENANQILLSQADDGIYKNIADKIELMSIILSYLVPVDTEAITNKIADLIIEIFPVLKEVFNNFKHNFKVSERLIKFFKVQVDNHTTYLVSILPELTELVNQGYKETKFGCYLWITGIIITDFNDDFVSEEVKQGVYDFAKIQAQLFLDWLQQILNGVNVVLLTSNERSANSQERLQIERKKLVDKLIAIEDKIEDFFRMLIDLIAQFPFKFVAELNTANSFVHHAFQIAILTLNLDKYDTIIYAVRFVMDFQAWGNPKPPIAFFTENPPEVRETVCKYLLCSHTGEFTANPIDTNALSMLNMLFKGLIFTFPKDAEYETYDLISKMLSLAFSVSNNDVDLIKSWIQFIMEDLPEATVSDKEKQKMLGEIDEALKVGSFRKVKRSIKTFISYYNRKHSDDK